MRHPFDGVNVPEEGLSRREALAALAAAAGLAGLAGTAQAQGATTAAIGEEGGPKITTLALGEEGGGGPATAPSTEPFGEEAGHVTSRAVLGLEGGRSVTAAAGEGGMTTRAIGEEGGATTKALREEGGGPTTLAKGEEGGLTRALNEAGGPVIPVQPGTMTLTEAQLKAMWADLADKDPVKGVQACAVLYGAKNSLDFMGKSLKADNLKLPQAEEKKVAPLIADLDAAEFAERQKAEEKLAILGTSAVAALEKALAETKSPEQKMRLGRLLQKARQDPNLRQAQRSLEILVALRTPEARKLLKSLTEGEEKEWLTQSARLAQNRLPKESK